MKRSNPARGPILGMALALLASIALFQLLQRQILPAAFAFGSHPEVIAQLEASLDDLRSLATLDEAEAGAYRVRFEAVAATLQRLQILDHSRETLIARVESILLVLFSALVLSVGTGVAWFQLRRDRRLARLQGPLSRLAMGQPAIETREKARDTIGRLASMIEETSLRMHANRQRLATLENLAAWQEATRRHVHEMRTPLTGLTLELSRIADSLEPAPKTLGGALQGAQQELERLREFTHHFSSFAKLPEPRLFPHDVHALLSEVLTAYTDAWPNLQPRVGPPPETMAMAALDRDMIRQVIVNLCENSVQAGRGSPVRLSFEIEVESRSILVRCADDGPGIDPMILDRLFQPYATTRPIGEGMGLGLAISKKILLDHGGDLELEASTPAGSTFLWRLPLAQDLTQDQNR